VEAVDNGLLDLHRFEAGGAERIGGLEPENQDRRPKEFFEDLFWEFLDLIGEAVADGATNPLFDRMSGDLLRTGVEAGVVSPSESGIARGRHSGLWPPTYYAACLSSRRRPCRRYLTSAVNSKTP
jgi:hypothetical protein